MEEKQEENGKERKRAIWIAMGILGALVLAAVIGGICYWNAMLNLMKSPA